jgi:hypothetical protein
MARLIDVNDRYGYTDDIFSLTFCTVRVIEIKARRVVSLLLLMSVDRHCVKYSGDTTRLTKKTFKDVYFTILFILFHNLVIDHPQNDL